MTAEIRCHSEGLVTLATSLLLFTSMSSFVLGTIIVSAKIMSTHLTMKNFLSNVTFLMPFQDFSTKDLST